MNHKLTPSEYQVLALRTAPPFKSREYGAIKDYLLHGALGICTEVAEIVEDPDNSENVMQEIGDVMWYCSLICSALGVNLGDVAFKPVDKKLTDLVSYSGIVADCVKRHVYYSTESKKVPLDELQITHAISMIQSCLKELSGDKLGECLDMNIKKLRIRYPDKFNTESALNRDLDSEQQIYKS